MVRSTLLHLPSRRPLRGKFQDFRLSMTLFLKFGIFCKFGSKCAINPKWPISENSIKVKGFTWCNPRLEPTAHEGGTKDFHVASDLTFLGSSPFRSQGPALMRRGLQNSLLRHINTWCEALSSIFPLGGPFGGNSKIFVYL